MKPLAILLLSLILVVPPTRPPGKRILFVVDVSGSMRGVKFDQAVSAFRELSQQPTDDAEIAILAFRDGVQRYPAEGWIQLPDARELEAAATWLRTRFAGGDTLVIPALRLAAESDADVVIITDGVFQREEAADVVSAVPEGRLGVLGVGRKSGLLERMAQRGGLGYWRVEPQPWIPGPFKKK